jgi:hypothetical protein
MRFKTTVMWLLLSAMTPALAQVSIGIGLPGLSIGINLPLYPHLVQVPNHPVYYAPDLDSNFFFYDGMYWVYQGDNWYASSWYNGPWGHVSPGAVPLFVLRIPVRYYRQPPSYFRGWRRDAPPRWGEHWGNEWEREHSDWERWDRRSAPAPAPLPDYQRRYSGDRYPGEDRQRELRNEEYRYQPRGEVARQHYEGRQGQDAPGPSSREQQRAPEERNARPEDGQRSDPPRAREQGETAAPRLEPPRARDDVQRPAPAQDRQRQSGPPAQDQRPQSRAQQAPPEQRAQRPESRDRPQGGDASRGQEREQGREQGREQEQERGQQKDRGRGEERDQDRKR